MLSPFAHGGNYTTKTSEPHNDANINTIHQHYYTKTWYLVIILKSNPIALNNKPNEKH